MVQHTDPLSGAGVTAIGERYRVLSLLGRGGMADVFRATDELLDRDVALKMLRDVTDDPADRRRFIKEARTLAQLDHHGLVTLLDAGLDGERPYLVMELVPGTTLREHCAEPCNDLRWVAHIGAQVAEALSAVHAAGVVHRDVKPGNILIDGERAWLTDFGIARMLGDQTRHTRTGTTIGTAAYLAPEQVTGDPVSTAADVYALGLVLQEVLTGERAYAGTAVEAALARLHRPPEPPAGLPDPWRRLLGVMTAQVAQDRPTAAEVAHSLQQLAVLDDREDATSDTAVLHDDPPTAILPGAPPRAGAAPADKLAAVADRARTGAQRHPLVAVALVGALLIALTAVVTSIGGSGAAQAPAPAAEIERDADGLPTGLPTGLREQLADLHRAVRE